MLTSFCQPMGEACLGRRWGGRAKQLLDYCSDSFGSLPRTPSGTTFL